MDSKERFERNVALALERHALALLNDPLRIVGQGATMYACWKGTLLCVNLPMVLFEEVERDVLLLDCDTIYRLWRCDER